MPEPTLNLANAELESDVGIFLGMGGGTNHSETAWNDRNYRKIRMAVSSGLRMFYFPMPLPGDAASYDWSFIRPTRQVVLISGETSVALPDDFGGVSGSFQIVQENRIYCVVEVTNEQRVSRLHNDVPSVTGQPRFCAVRTPSTTSATKGQRSNLFVYPTADQDYTLEFQMFLNPDALSASFPYALGGTTHAETIRAACKAAAERDINNIQNGPQYQHFLERLKASVSLDRRNKAQVLGPNLDPGYNRGRYYYNRQPIEGVVTVDGVTP